jgi:hypothetical protein
MTAFFFRLRSRIPDISLDTFLISLPLSAVRFWLHLSKCSGRSIEIVPDKRQGLAMLRLKSLAPKCLGGKSYSGIHNVEAEPEGETGDQKVSRNIDVGLETVEKVISKMLR